MRTVSIGNMIKSLSGMLGTKDFNDFENKFVTNMRNLTDDGAKSSILTSSQVEKVEEIYQKHFA